jgi:acyl carrier protein
MTASELVAEILKRPVNSFNRDQLLDQLPQFDSLALVNLVVRLEGVLGRQLTESEIEGVKTIGSIEDLLKVGG